MNRQSFPRFFCNIFFEKASFSAFPTRFSGEVRNQSTQIGCEEANADGEKNDAKELPQKIDGGFGNQRFYFFRGFQHAENENHVQQKSNQNVDLRKFRTEGKQRGERTGTGNEREHNGNECRLLDGTLVLENFNVENHLQTHQEDDKTAGNGERLNIYVEKPQQDVAGIEESNQQHQRNDRGFPSVDGTTLLLEIDENRSGAQHINDSKEHNESTHDLLNADAGKKIIECHD